MITNHDLWKYILHSIGMQALASQYAGYKKLDNTEFQE